LTKNAWSRLVFLHFSSFSLQCNTAVERRQSALTASLELDLGSPLPWPDFIIGITKSGRESFAGVVCLRAVIGGHILQLCGGVDRGFCNKGNQLGFDRECSPPGMIMWRRRWQKIQAYVTGASQLTRPMMGQR